MSDFFRCRHGYTESAVLNDSLPKFLRGICGTEQEEGTNNYPAPSKPCFMLRSAPGITHTALCDVDKVGGKGR